jgi:hypothetical protein
MRREDIDCATKVLTGPPTPRPTPTSIERVEITPQPTDPPTNPPIRFVYTPQPTDPPTNPPTPMPTPNPTPDPTPRPTRGPFQFAVVTESPTKNPTPDPTPLPTPDPTPLPTPNPTSNPTPLPTLAPMPSSSPSGAPTPCDEDPCQLRFVDDTQASCDPFVQTIIEIDSWCGVRWDPWCVITYSDCYEQSGCDAASIGQIANEGNVDRTRIKCPENISDAITVVPVPMPPLAEGAIEEATCPEAFPGSGASCEATNLQCYYFYGDIEWVCNCGASPTEFFCKPKNE